MIFQIIKFRDAKVGDEDETKSTFRSKAAANTNTTTINSSDGENEIVKCLKEENERLRSELQLVSSLILK